MKYLHLSPHRIYYFRSKIPQALSLLADKKIIRLSLATRDKREGITRCHISTAIFKCGIKRIEAKIMRHANQATDEIRELVNSEILSLLQQIRSSIDNYESKIDFVVAKLTEQERILGGDL